MALEHALLVSLRERPASGLDLNRRFVKSIGYFWRATHQQIYKVLARMEADGWVTATVVPQDDRPAKKVYAVSPAGESVLADWLEQPTGLEPIRSEVAVRMRGASYGDRGAVRRRLADHLDLHRGLLATYEDMLATDYPDPSALHGHDRDVYHVLRGGVLTEQAAVTWLDDYLRDLDD